MTTDRYQEISAIINLAERLDYKLNQLEQGYTLPGLADLLDNLNAMLDKADMEESLT